MGRGYKGSPFNHNIISGLLMESGTPSDRMFPIMSEVRFEMVFRTI